MKPTLNNPLQDKAISLGLGPAMILAGPGSGKTYIITHRISYLIERLNISPSDILVITFTKAAANEMKERFIKLSPRYGNDVLFATFHSAFYSFLKSLKPGYNKGIISNSERFSILEDLSAHYNQLMEADVEDPETLLNEISHYKSNNEQFDFRFNFSQQEKEYFLIVYKEYKERLDAINKIDYDDIILDFYDFLLTDENALSYLNLKYKAILVDEFQDINSLQYSIVKLLSKNKNIFVVGDDDQSIYGFRGSKPEIMNTFLKDFEGAEVISLEYNYRSVKDIIDASYEVISQNGSRLHTDKQKPIRSNKDSLFLVKEFKDRNKQFLYINKIIENEISNDRYVCILCRTNKDVIYYRQLLSGDDTNLSKVTTEIYLDVLAYISAVTRKDRSSFVRIINKPVRFVPMSIFDDDIVDINNLSGKYLGSYKSDALQILSRHFKILEKSTSFAFIKYLFNIVGYRKYLLEQYPNTDIDVITANLENMAKENKSLQSFEAKLDADAKNLFSKSSKVSARINKNVSVMTFHASKGLEFDTVIIPDVNEGKIPGQISIKDDNLYEERRLFYVAMTRARYKLIITYLQKEESTSVLPSRFIRCFLDKPKY